MSSSSFPPALLLALTLVGIIGVVGVWIAVFLLRGKSAALRHWLWLLALSAPLFALPLAWPHAPRIRLPILPERLQVAQSSLWNTNSISNIKAENIRQYAENDRLHDLKKYKISQGYFKISFNPWWVFWFAGATVVMLRIVISHIQVRRLLEADCAPGSEGIDSPAWTPQGNPTVLVRPMRLLK